MSGFIVTLCLAITYLITNSLFSTDIHADAKKLQKRFKDLGNMALMSKNDIIHKVGPPNSVSNINGKQLLQWQKTGYHIAILFDENGFFDTITHESAT